MTSDASSSATRRGAEVVRTIQSADGERDDDRRQEHQRPTTSAGDEVAEARDQRVEDRRYVARTAGCDGRWGRRLRVAQRFGRRPGVGPIGPLLHPRAAG